MAHIATNLKGVSSICHRKAAVVARTRSEKEKISWRVSSFAVTLLTKSEDLFIIASEKV
jgi:hypothetical protein